MDRHFFHSFPRIRPNDSTEKIISDGLKILKCISENGLILAPEIVTWNQSLPEGKHRTITNRQVRISFTELDSNELETHSKIFGPFSLEFDIVELRKLGVLPVMYIPQHIGEGVDYSGIGASIVVHTADTKYVLNQFKQLEDWLDINYIRKFHPEATHISPDAVFDLKNSDPNDPQKIVQSFQVPVKSIRDLLSYIGYRNAPFDLMIGVLNAAQNLFYPTDDQIHDELLAYYRQREWRLIAGIGLRGKSQSRSLTNEEKAILIEINPTFWQRELKDDTISLKRVDEAVIIESYWGGHISNLITKIRVPQSAYEKACEIFPGKVIINQFN